MNNGGKRRKFRLSRSLFIGFSVLLLFFCLPSLGQPIGHFGERKAVKDKLFSDTLITSKGYKKQLEKSTKLYDSMYRSKSWFGRTLSSLLITSPQNSSDNTEPTPVLEVGRHYFQKYAGKKIVAINIVQANVFSRDTAAKLSWVEKTLDKLHVLTHKKEIEQNLLFKVGDSIVPYTMAINEELLRSLPYIATSYIVVSPVASNADEVVVNIFARDNWTISGDLAWGSNSWVSAFDRNFLGSGNQLLLRYYFKRGNQNHGFEAQYNINNIWGTFANVNLKAGVGYTNNGLSIVASRPFLLPSDHIWGFKAGYEQSNQGIRTMDTTMLINNMDFGAWYGYSLNIDKRLGTSFYAVLSGEYTEFIKRPFVLPNINPFYYNRTTALMSVGFSRQNYFQGNMIYGYGRTEDIPFGYKFELIGGIQWSEVLGRRYYAGASAVWGDLLGSSFLNLKAQAGSFFNENGTPQQSVINLELNYFTPLFRLGSIYLRQFFFSSATWGLHRMWGEREQIGYNSIAKVRGMGNTREQLGYNRFTAGFETVFFTPIFLYHFRFAFFAWGDVGILGYDPNIFQGSISSAVGIGVRIKNERLIFNNIQLRLGFSIIHPDGVTFSPFSISNEQELRLDSYRPAVPQIIPYQ